MCGFWHAMCAHLLPLYFIICALGNSKFAWPPQQNDQNTCSGPTATPLYISPPHLIQNAPTSAEPNDKSISPKLSQYSAPDAVSETPAVNVTPHQNTQVDISDVPPQMITLIQQLHNETLQTQAIESATMNFTQQTVQSNGSEQYESHAKHDTSSVCKVNSSVTPLLTEFSEVLMQMNVQDVTEKQQNSVQYNKMATVEHTHGTDMHQALTQPEHSQPVSNETIVTGPEVGGVENFGHQEMIVSDQNQTPLRKTVKTVKVSEEFSRQTKEVEIVKASCGVVATESIKTASSESNIQQQSISQSIEMTQRTEKPTEPKYPRESQTNCATAADVSQLNEMQKNITKYEVQESSQTLQHEVQIKEAQKIVSDYVTDQAKQDVETKSQEVKEINSITSTNFQTSDVLQMKATTPAMYQQAPPVSKSPPPPPSSSPIDPQMQLPSLPHQKRMSLLEALTIAPEKKFSININIAPSQALSESSKPIQKMDQVCNGKGEVDQKCAKEGDFMPQPEFAGYSTLGDQGSRFPGENKKEICEQPKDQIKTQQQEIKKQVENINVVQQQVLQNQHNKGQTFIQKPASGLGGALILPYYQQDLEWYQMQRALSPAPHFRVPGSRSPSPAPPIDTESLKHAYKFGAPLSPRGMHRSAKDLGGLTVQTELQGTSKKQSSQEITQYMVQSGKENMLQKDFSTFLLKPTATQNIPHQQHKDKKTSDIFQKVLSPKEVAFGPQIKVTTPFQQAGFQTPTAMPFPHIPLPDNQILTNPQQFVSVSATSVPQKSNFQSPSVMTQIVTSTSGPTTQVLPKSSVQTSSAVVQNVSSIPRPTSQVPQKPSCTAATPAGGGGGGGGVGGGKAAASVAGSTTPRRGRGILNQPGARIPLCGSCNSQIRGPFITALGKIWCPEHFICVNEQCRRPLQDIGFVEEKGKLYCEYCFEKYIAPTCDKCNTKVKGDCLNAIGKHFHPECFLCAYCGKLFGNSPFFLEDGLPYCEADWNELFTTKCFACGFPIEAGDRWVEALNNNYHSQCFTCTNCKKNLEGESFYAKGGRPFCKAHAR